MDNGQEVVSEGPRLETPAPILEPNKPPEVDNAGGAKPKTPRKPVPFKIPMNDILKKKMDLLTPKEKERVNNRSRILLSASGITAKNLSDYGGCYQDGGKNYTADGHQTLGYDLHYWCAKCQVYSDQTPCCMDFNDLCTTGEKMDKAVLLARHANIKRWQAEKAKGEFPILRSVPKTKRAQSDGSSTCSDTVSVTQDEAQYEAMDTTVQQPTTVSETPTVEELGTITETLGQALANGDMKPVTTSTDVRSILTAGNADAFQGAMREVKKMGKETVDLVYSRGQHHDQGLPLNKEAVLMINARLDELNTHWSQPDTDINVIPATKRLLLNAAPYETVDSCLRLKPMQFPAVTTPGVRPGKLTGASTVHMSQSDLGFLEQVLKFSVYAVSTTKALSSLSIKQMREQDEKLEQVSQQLTEAEGDLAKALKKRPKTKRRNKRKANGIPEAEKSIGEDSDAEEDNESIPEFTAQALEESLDLAHSDAFAGLITALVSVVIARRRSILTKDLPRAQKRHILTRPITNTFHLM